MSGFVNTNWLVATWSKVFVVWAKVMLLVFLAMSFHWATMNFVMPMLASNFIVAEMCQYDPAGHISAVGIGLWLIYAMFSILICLAASIFLKLKRHTSIPTVDYFVFGDCGLVLSLAGWGAFLFFLIIITRIVLFVSMFIKDINPDTIFRLNVYTLGIFIAVSSVAVFHGFLTEFKKDRA